MSYIDDANNETQNGSPDPFYQGQSAKEGNWGLIEGSHSFADQSREPKSEMPGQQDDDHCEWQSSQDVDSNPPWRSATPSPKRDLQAWFQEEGGESQKSRPAPTDDERLSVRIDGNNNNGESDMACYPTTTSTQQPVSKEKERDVSTETKNSEEDSNDLAIPASVPTDDEYQMYLLGHTVSQTLRESPGSSGMQIDDKSGIYQPSVPNQELNENIPNEDVGMGGPNEELRTPIVFSV